MTLTRKDILNNQRNVLICSSGTFAKDEEMDRSSLYCMDTPGNAVSALTNNIILLVSAYNYTIQICFVFVYDLFVSQALYLCLLFLIMCFVYMPFVFLCYLIVCFYGD